MTDDFTAADAARMSVLFLRRFDGTLTDAEHTELVRLANAWQHAYTRLLPVPEGWTPPEPTEAMVRAALAKEGTMSKRIACKVCGQSFAAWWTDGKGRRRDNWARLRDHYLDAHPLEGAELIAAIQEWETAHLAELGEETAQ